MCKLLSSYCVVHLFFDFPRIVNESAHVLTTHQTSAKGKRTSMTMTTTAMMMFDAAIDADFAVNRSV